MASVTGATITPPIIPTHGGSAKAVPIISDPDVIANLTLSIDGTTFSGQIALHENLSYSINPSDKGKPGYFVAEIDQPGIVLAWNPDGSLGITTP